MNNEWSEKLTWWAKQFNLESPMYVNFLKFKFGPLESSQNAEDILNGAGFSFFSLFFYASSCKTKALSIVR